MKRALVLLLGLLLAGSVLAVAGDDSSAASAGIPRIITFIREDIKIGKMSAHDDLVRAVRRTATEQRADLYWVAGRSLTGNTSDFVNIRFFNNYADIDRANEAFANAMRANMQNVNFSRDAVDSHVKGREIIAEYREDLSYGQPRFDIANSTRWKVTFVQLKPGTTSDYAEARRTAMDLWKQANADVNSIAYEVTAGAPSPTFIFLTSLRSLADLDVDRSAAMKKVYSPAIKRHLSNVDRDSVVSKETSIIAVRPEISRPTDAIVAANPSYWTVRDEPVVARDRRGRTAVQPATMKEKDASSPKN